MMEMNVWKWRYQYDTCAYYELVDCYYIVFDHGFVATFWVFESKNGENGVALVLHPYDHNGGAFII